MNTAENVFETTKNAFETSDLILCMQLFIYKMKYIFMFIILKTYLIKPVKVQLRTANKLIMHSDTLFEYLFW